MPESETFIQATKTCNAYGGEMLNLKNQKEWDFYRNYLEYQSIIRTIWLGIKAEYVIDYIRPDGSELFFDTKDWCYDGNFSKCFIKVLFKLYV
jgi:hypothetical protein